MSSSAGVKKYFAELVGTMILVLAGCGSAVLAGDRIGFLGIAFAFGLSLLALVYVIGQVSGCHVNPAVSISMLAAGKMKPKTAALYVVAQCVGAVIGAALLYFIAVGNPAYTLAKGLGQNGYDVASPTGFTITSAFVAEFLLTFVFVLVVHGATSEKVPKGFAGIAIGLGLALVHLVGIPVTGTSVNPARSLGPAVIVGGLAINQLWLFWVAPILGGLLAAAVWRILE